MSQHIITKKIAKHGSQAIIVVPRLLEQELSPGTVVRLTIDVIDRPEKKDNSVNTSKTDKKEEVQRWL